ncbi:MAG TPA: hypothetical protein DEG06_10805 [Lachnospiraceae bacterium]|nr:hypothetical protein [Lachnospiraceae bacterium]
MLYIRSIGFYLKKIELSCIGVAILIDERRNDMFGQYFGRYLLEKNRISQTEFNEIIAHQKSSPAKLGVIAVAEKLLTAKQADEVNELQKQMDLRFGDVAIEKGYLLSEEVAYLLNMQGNPYSKFVQAITENNVLTIEEIEKYLEDYKKENGFTDYEIDALKSGDIDRIIPLFVEADDPFLCDYISLAIRNLVRFINNEIVLQKSYRSSEYTFGNLAYQHMEGEHQIFAGFASGDDELLHIAEPFAKEKFGSMNDDAFDSVCEFINCSNGLFTSKLSEEDIHIDMAPPLFEHNKNIKTSGEFLIIPVLMDGAKVELIVAVNSLVKIN